MGWIGDEIADVLDSLHDGTLMDGGLDVSVTITIKNTVKGAYNATTGARAETTTTATASALVSDYSLEEIGNSGGLIVHGDIRFIILAADGAAIDQHSKITYDGADYRVMTRKPRVIDGAVYDYEIQGRR